MLCEDCCDEIAGSQQLALEQIQLHGLRPTLAALVDKWGIPHRLDARTLVGRQVEGHGLALLEPSISRHHAHLTLDDGVWTVRDLGSANGTYVDDARLEAATPLRDGARVRFGHIGFYFVENVTQLPAPLPPRNTTKTLPHPPPATAVGSATHALPDDDDDRAAADADEENTDVGLPGKTFKLFEPAGGGGGLIEVDGKVVQLTLTQFELMHLMIHRMYSEHQQPDMVRGYVRSAELIGQLSWDARDPGENHVKQLVRRTRRALAKAGIGPLIEALHGFGYRIRAIPRELVTSPRSFRRS